VIGKTSFTKDPFNAKGTARDIGGVLEYASISGHERRGRKTEHLPKGEIPRHDGKHDTQGLARHKTFARIRGDEFRP
jgi:hypothetical protein